MPANSGHLRSRGSRCFKESWDQAALTTLILVIDEARPWNAEKATVLNDFYKNLLLSKHYKSLLETCSTRLTVREVTQTRSNPEDAL